jgi:hypothetical protein
VFRFAVFDVCVEHTNTMAQTSLSFDLTYARGLM